jgi:Protein of unknown function (DUF3631)
MSDLPNIEAVGEEAFSATSSDPLLLLGQLSEAADPADIELALRHFGGIVRQLDSLAQQTLRDAAVRRLKAIGCKRPSQMVDAALSVKRNEQLQGSRIELLDPKPWPDTVDGAEMLDEMVLVLRRFLAISPHAIVAIVLWCLLTYVFDAFDVLPLLAIVSPEKRCGAMRFADDNIELLRGNDPAVPEKIKSDRARDNWRSLLAIADLVGGSWPERARESAVFLTSGETTQTSDALLLLGDLRDLFIARAEERIPSDDIVRTLKDMQERPWPTFDHGREITAKNVANLLRPFGIKSVQYRFADNSNRRGYSLDQLRDTFERYLEPLGALQPLRSSESKAYEQSGALQREGDVTTGEDDKPNRVNNVMDVTPQSDLSRQREEHLKSFEKKFEPDKGDM